MADLARRRLERWALPFSTGLALLGATLLLAACAAWISAPSGWAYDFAAYYEAAQRLGAQGTVYAVETLAGPFRPGPYGLYLYPPPLAILFAPLTALGSAGATLVWLVLRVALLAATCALMPVSRAVRLATFGVAALSVPFLVDLNLGNVSLIVTFVGVLVWRWLDRPIAGVALAAALMLRPTMALVAAWWLVRGVWRPVVAATIAVLLIVAITVPFVGIDGWLDYVTVARNVTGVTGVYRNYDLGSSTLLLGGSSGLATIALFAGYALTVAAMVLSLRRDRELSYVVTFVGTVLVAPLLWDHYLTVLIVPAAFLASRGRPIGLLLPLLCWLPYLTSEAWLPFVAIAGLLLPFAVPDKGEPAARNIRELVRARRQSA